jgi:DNA/RNA endonuclease G (NUC1)
MLMRLFLGILSALCIFAKAPAQQTETPYRHDLFLTLPQDSFRSFTAFVVSFDGADDGVALGLPEWVAYELRSPGSASGGKYERPSTWATDEALHQQCLAPDDSSYRDSGYSRGHMCMKSHASRLGAVADRETHTLLNACPQLQNMNAGVWLAIENLTGDWADSFGNVWIVTGPVFTRAERQWIGDPGEVPVAVPDAFFKIVVRLNGSTPEVLAFLVPMEGDDAHSKQSADVRPYLTSVDVIEALTKLDFLTGLADPTEAHLECRMSTVLWNQQTPSLDARPPPTIVSSESNLPNSAPIESPATSQPTVSAPKSDVKLRDGIEPTASETALGIKAAGREYVMPRPKSARASWNNGDGHTTWWAGYWHNATSRSYSTAQPTVSAPKSDVKLRDGIEPTASETALALGIKAAGWEYVMPCPKSAQASWGNGDGRTTWYNGYWHNAKSSSYSAAQPGSADGFKGDGINNQGWRRGGSPGSPNRIEWLCSASGGIMPRQKSNRPMIHDPRRSAGRANLQNIMTFSAAAGTNYTIVLTVPSRRLCTIDAAIQCRCHQSQLKRMNKS